MVRSKAERTRLSAVERMSDHLALDGLGTVSEEGSLWFVSERHIRGRSPMRAASYEVVSFGDATRPRMIGGRGERENHRVR